MISRELLSEVLNEEVEEIFIFSKNTIGYYIKDNFNGNGKQIEHKINIHEIAYKCKKWVYGLGYDIKESKNSLIISKLTSTGHERVLVERYKLHGVKPEEIIEECQHILEQKAKS